MDEFTASNGYRIVQGSEEPKPVATWLSVHNRNPDPDRSERHRLGLYSVEALREFFRAEEDERLGRWRDAPDEEWRTIPGYEGFYEVSSHGRVRSIPRTLVDGRARQGKVLRQCTTRGNGRLKVTLSREGVSQSVKIHQLVAQAFLGPAPEGKTLVLHSDGNHLNNNAANLRWGNYSDNVRDSIAHGTHRNQYTVEKPWHDANADEVWLLTIDGAEPEAYRTEQATTLRFFAIRAENNMTYGTRSAGITDGRRIWPEVTP